MINFTNNSQVFKMKEVAVNTFDSVVGLFYIDGEETIACYQALRDFMIFTNHRMIHLEFTTNTNVAKLLRLIGGFTL